MTNQILQGSRPSACFRALFVLCIVLVCVTTIVAAADSIDQMSIDPARSNSIVLRRSRLVSCASTWR